MSAERLAELLQETNALALRERVVTPQELRQVNVDTTVQEKNITYRGHDYQGTATVHIAGSSNRGLTRTLRVHRRRRSAIEPKIGHLKSDHRLGRCFLRGLPGDAINALLAAAGSNLRKLLRWLCGHRVYCSGSSQHPIRRAQPPHNRCLLSPETPINKHSQRKEGSSGTTS